MYNKPINAVEIAKTQLRHVTLLFRHGIRSPLSVYPTNPNKAEYWQRYGGLGQLTPNGVKQLYEFGEYLKVFYANFLHKDYDRRNVYVRSTDLDRTLMSAQAFVAGLYKPNEYQTWNDNLTWIPIPVHTTNSTVDSMFTYGLPCPKYERLRDDFLKSEEHNRMIKANEEFVRNLSSLSGLSLELYDVWKIPDNTLAELAEGLQVSDWIRTTNDKATELKDYTYYVDYGTLEKARFFAGGSINEIRNNLKKKIDNTLSYQISIYSNHDSYMGALLSVLNFSWPIKQPPFNAAILVELREDEQTNKNYVRILFKNNQPDEPIEISEVKIKGCEVMCPIDKFMSITSKKIMINYREDCALSSSASHSSKFFFNIKTSFFMQLVLFTLYVNSLY